MLDNRLRIVSANRAFYETFQTAPEKIEGRFIHELADQVWNIPEFLALLERILLHSNQQEGLELDHEFPVLGRRVMLLNARWVYEERGETDRILLAISDITERKRAEEALAAEKERLAVTLWNIGEGVIVADVRGTISLLNRTAEQLTGWTAQEAIGRRLDEVFLVVDERTREPCGNPVALVLQPGSPRQPLAAQGPGRPGRDRAPARRDRGPGPRRPRRHHRGRDRLPGPDGRAAGRGGPCQERAARVRGRARGRDRARLQQHPHRDRGEHPGREGAPPRGPEGVRAARRGREGRAPCAGPDTAAPDLRARRPADQEGPPPLRSPDRFDALCALRLEGPGRVRHREGPLGRGGRRGAAQAGDQQPGDQRRPGHARGRDAHGLGRERRARRRGGPDPRGGRLRPDPRLGYRGRDPEGARREDLRAVLHDQADRERARSDRRLLDRAQPRRDHRGRAPRRAGPAPSSPSTSPPATPPCTGRPRLRSPRAAATSGSSGWTTRR